MVRDDDDGALAGLFAHGPPERLENGVLRERLAARRGVARLRERVEPPLGVERDEPHPRAEVDGDRSRAPVFRLHPGAPRLDERPLALDACPAVFATLGPVVVAGNEQRARAPSRGVDLNGVAARVGPPGASPGTQR
jgi:hypothetical protein